MKQSIVECIGNTPVVRLQCLSELCGCDILVKCENMNPFSNSIKDRCAYQLILDGLESGVLKENMTIIEATAGNTGIALASIAKLMNKNLKMLAVLPESIAEEKQNILRMYGAEIQLAPLVPFTNPEHFYQKAKRLAQEHPEKYIHLDQFENLSNYKAHYTKTGPEILSEVPDLDVFCCASGTGGTISGCSSYLKSKNKDIKVVLLDPQGSALQNYIQNGKLEFSAGSSFTEGIGTGRITANFAQAQIDSAITVTDQDALSIAYYVREKEGILLGGSSAINVAGAFITALSQFYKQNKKILTFLCDGGERSASRLYSSEFLKTRELEYPNGEPIEQFVQKYSPKN